MCRTFVSLFVATLVAGAATPALAQGSYYSATAAAEVGKASVVTRDTVWKCTGTTCTAARASNRDTVMCELLVQRVGALAAFNAGGVAYDDAALKKCNARAR